MINDNRLKHMIELWYTNSPRSGNKDNDILYIGVDVFPSPCGSLAADEIDRLLTQLNIDLKSDNLDIKIRATETAIRLIEGYDKITAMMTKGTIDI